MPSPQTPPKSIFHPKERNRLIELLEARATAEELAKFNQNRIQTLPSKQNVINGGPGGAPVKRSNAAAAAAAARRAPKNMNNNQVNAAVRGLFKAANAFVN